MAETGVGPQESESSEKSGFGTFWGPFSSLLGMAKHNTWRIMKQRRVFVPSERSSQESVVLADLSRVELRNVLVLSAVVLA